MAFLLPWARGASEAFALAVPLVGFGVGVLAWRLWRQGPDRVADGRTRDVALAGAIAIVVVMTLFPRDIGDASQLKLVPFQNLFDALSSDRGLRGVLAELIGNVVLFVPLGMALRWRFTGWSIAGVTVVALLISVTIETLQAVSATGRWASTTDVIANTLGGLIGATLIGMWVRSRPER
jgi:glycopeptide antibiotics resistance protein